MRFFTRKQRGAAVTGDALAAAAHQTNGRPAPAADQPGESQPRRTTVRAFVVAGVLLYRDAVARLLADGCVAVVGSACDASDRARLRQLDPDVVLVDASTINGPLTVAAIAEAAPAAKVIAFAVRDSEAEIIALAESGVSGFVGREQSTADVVDAVRAVARGEVYCSRSIAAALLHRVAAAASHQRPTAVGRLTARELEIVELIDVGLTNREIAHRLCIELATVKNHVHNILEKLGVTDRAEAAARVRSMLA